ncbi:MAG: division/cell wall cluster transcriptional repressor MraZ [Chloroflexi bacterium]|nr:division/cell wall cluster transcriptional repressor MraZ [Chloroflexota bacterium]
MFLGLHYHSIDEKGRLTIPARYREILGEGAYITRGFDRNLMVLTTSTYDQLYQRLTDMNMASMATRRLRRLMLTNTFNVDLDKSGRILIPQILRQAANLDGEVIIAGQGNYFEVWTPELWAEQARLFEDPEANSSLYESLELRA